MSFRQIDGWDFVDALSYEIVKGLGQDRIASADRGFREMGLILAPSDAFEKYQNATWMA